MMPASENVRARSWEGLGASPSSVPQTAVERITVWLRHIDTQLASMKQEVSSHRKLSRLEDVPDVDQILRPIEDVLGAAAASLGLEPAKLDGRRALRGGLHILWADLIDMSAENLRKHWGFGDVPNRWPELHRELVSAVERAIAQL
jgi:hypothetical protein